MGFSFITLLWFLLRLNGVLSSVFAAHPSVAKSSVTLSFAFRNRKSSDTYPALAPPLSENDAVDFVKNSRLLRQINKRLGCAHSSRRLEVWSWELLREGAILIIWLSMIMRGRSMVVRGKCSMFAVCCVKPLKFKVAITLFEDCK